MTAVPLVAVRPAALSLGSIRSSLAAFAADFDATALTASQAAAAADDLTAIRNIAATLSALAAARVAESGAWRSSAPSPEAWLARAAGTTSAQAREELATARRLASLPEVDAAARDGVLSPRQAAAIAGAAEAAPEEAAGLLAAAAVEPLGVLQEQCQAVKAAADPDPMATYARQRAARSMVRRTDGEGMATLYWKTTAEERARFDAVIDPIIEGIFTAARQAGRREPREAYASDAMAELALLATTAATPGDVPPARGGAPTSGRSAERFLALLRVDAAALRRGRVEPGEVCEIPGVGPVPVPVARDLLGESVLKLVITRGTDVTTTCSLGRGPTAAMRIAKLWEQPLCLAAGCPNRAGLEHDHHHEWAAGGPTAAWNLNRLCSHHHDRKTRHGWSLVNGTGRRPMVPPDDPRHPKRKPPPRAGPP